MTVQGVPVLQLVRQIQVVVLVPLTFALLLAITGAAGSIVGPAELLVFALLALVPSNVLVLRWQRSDPA